jgi:hypothetical protein
MLKMRAWVLPAFGVLAMIACIAGSPSDVAAQDAGMTWLIFVDDLHLDFINTGHIRELLRSIASELIRDGDAFVLRSSGPSPSIAFTRKRSRLEAAIREITGNELPPSMILRWSPLNMDEARQRVLVAGSAATEMLTAGRLPSGRRAMLYITDGYHLEPPAATVAGFVEAAQRANVTVFALNARRLPGAAALSVRDDRALSLADRAAIVNSLWAISEPTGGFAVLDEQDFGDALLRIGRWLR